MYKDEQGMKEYVTKLKEQENQCKIWMDRQSNKERWYLDRRDTPEAWIIRKKWQC